MRKGTSHYRLRTAEVQVTLVLTLLAHGCPAAVIVAAFQLDKSNHTLAIVASDVNTRDDGYFILLSAPLFI